MSLYETLLDKLSGKEYYDYFAAMCPWDTHKTPALLVYPDGCWCLSCHHGWTLEQLAKKVGTGPTSLTQSHKSQVLPRWRDWEKAYGNLEGIAEHAHKNLLRYPKKYFKERQLHEYIHQGHFGYLDGWAVFPVYDSQHILVDIVVRAVAHKGDSRYVIHPIASGDSRCLYSPNWERVISSRVCYVVFGLIDTWAFESISLPVVTGITGKAVPVDRLRELHKRLIIVPDLDEEEDAHKIANEFGMGARVKILRYEEDTKDPDEIRIKYGNEHLLNLIGA